MTYWLYREENIYTDYSWGRNEQNYKSRNQNELKQWNWKFISIKYFKTFIKVLLRCCLITKAMFYMDAENQ